MNVAFIPLDSITMLHVDEERSVVSSAELLFTCSSCGNSNETDAVEFRTVNKLYGLVKVWVTSETALKCPSCNATFRCSETPDDLTQLSAEQLSNRFRLRIGLVEKFLVIAGWLVVWTGPVSLILFLVAFFIIPKAVKGWRLASLLGIGMSVLISVMFVLGMFL